VLRLPPRERDGHCCRKDLQQVSEEHDPGLRGRVHGPEPPKSKASKSARMPVEGGVFMVRTYHDGGAAPRAPRTGPASMSRFP
jgi:hypothetical protein